MLGGGKGGERKLERGKRRRKAVAAVFAIPGFDLVVSRYCENVFSQAVYISSLRNLQNVEHFSSYVKPLLPFSIS